MRFGAPKVAHLAHHAAQFGTMTGPVATDMAKVRQRKRDMVEREIDFHLQQLQDDRRRIDHGDWAFCGTENARGAPE